MRVCVSVAAVMTGVFASSIAFAADLPARLPTKAPAQIVAYNWSGIYAGVHGGYGWQSTQWDEVDPPPANEGTHIARGWLAGGQIGVNHQIGRFVVGVEADASWADLNGSNLSAAGFLTVNSTHTDRLGMLTGRVGVTFDRTLLYLKGGAAWVHNEYSAVDVNPANPTFNRTVVTADETRWGWVAGAGVEQALWDNWSARVEYAYIHLGRHVLAMNTDPAFSPGVVEGFKPFINVVKVGLNYRFQSWR